MRSPSSRPIPTTSGRSSRTSRPSRRSCPTARGRSPRHALSRTRIREGGFGRGMAQVHRRRGPPGAVHRGGRRGTRPGSRDVRPADRGRRQPDRPAAVPEHHLVHALRARLRCASRGADADRDRRRHRVGGPARASAAGLPPPSNWAREPFAFPSDHGGFLGGEYGQAGDPDAFAAKLREVLAG